MTCSPTASLNRHSHGHMASHARHTISCIDLPRSTHIAMRSFEQLVDGPPSATTVSALLDCIHPFPLRPNSTRPHHHLHPKRRDLRRTSISTTHARGRRLCTALAPFPCLDLPPSCLPTPHAGASWSLVFCSSARLPRTSQLRLHVLNWSLISFPAETTERLTDSGTLIHVGGPCRVERGACTTRTTFVVPSLVRRLSEADQPPPTFETRLARAVLPLV